VRKFVAVLLATLIAVPRVNADCDWAAKISSAFKRRYETNEAACKALAAPPEQFNQAHALIEAEALRQVPLVSFTPHDYWLKAASDRMLASMGIDSAMQVVLVSTDAVPNAFASGQHVVLHQGIIDWYLDPYATLLKMGVSRQEASVYLQGLTVRSPGQNGLIAVLAHETAHNILGHPDVRPLVLACEDYIDSGVREVNEYRQIKSTGKRGSRFAAFFRAVGFLGSDIFFGSQRQQQYESDADELGAWLAYKITGDPNTVANSLQWLAAFPGAVGNANWSSVLCSDHPNLLLRVNKMRSSSFSVISGPPRQLLNLPQNATQQRYEQFASWYPAQIDQIDRIARGELTEAEKMVKRQVQIELKPKDASGLLDGEPFTAGKQKLNLVLGPHTLVGEAAGRKLIYEFVVFADGPDKFKLEVK
jgi:Zn-dependent protease with chaperone function